MLRLVMLWSIVTAGSAAHAQPAKIAVLPTTIDASASELAPPFIDDHLLTALQELNKYEVISPDDINSMLGFEKNKALVGCDDVACMADIAGALGVDKLVVFKVGRLGNEWSTTGKLINIRHPGVDERTTDFVPGDGKALLEAIPGLVAKLMGEQAPAGAVPPVPPVAPATPSASASGSTQAPGPTTPPTETGEPLYKNTWFWAAVGVAAAAAVVAAVVIVSGSDGGSTTDTAPAPAPSAGSTGGGGTAILSW